MQGGGYGFDSRRLHSTETLSNPRLRILASDPMFQTPLAFTRMTAKAVHEQLKANMAGRNRHVPAKRTVHDILNRLGYRLRPVLKTKPQKKS